MVGLIMTKLVETIGADVRAITGLTRIVYLIGALASNITRVPFGARWGSSSILLLLLLFPGLELSWDRLYGLHHTGGVKFGPNACPSCVAIVQVIEDPGAVVPRSVPGKGRIV